MRLSIDYEMSGELLPKDYRSGFMSLIKAAIQRAHPLLYQQYYAKWELKPFTFSVYFPEMKGTENGGFRVGSKLRLTVSTHSLELATHIYNGFLSKDLRSYKLFQSQEMYRTTLERKGINLFPTPTIHSPEVIFKTASPVLVNRKREDENDWFLLPWDEGFLDGLRFIVGETAKAFLGREGPVPLDFEMFERDGKVSIKRRVVSHYNQNMSAMVGTFKLKSDPEILQLIYDVGLGVRRSQGFGMLEVVR